MQSDRSEISPAAGQLARAAISIRLCGFRAHCAQLLNSWFLSPPSKFDGRPYLPISLTSISEAFRLVLAGMRNTACKSGEE
jgi:hypothetical protein